MKNEWRVYTRYARIRVMADGYHITENKLLIFYEGSWSEQKIVATFNEWTHFYNTTYSNFVSTT